MESGESGPTGRVLDGRYELRERIGRGAMADVYLAVDRRLGRQVAVKLLDLAYAADPDAAERFRRETGAAARIAHPNVVQVHDCGVAEDGQLYLVMELVDGASLDEVLRRHGRLTETQALSLSAQVAAGLAAAHRLGLVHRDVKPQNVLVDAEGRARVVDFGIARSTMEAGGRVTQAGGIVGTAFYLAPEQITGQAADARADLYSLGVVLYELLTGRPPFNAGSVVAVALQHVNAPVPPPRELRPGLSPHVEALVLKALAKDPADRFQTADEMRAALRAAMRVPPQPRAHVAPQPARRRPAIPASLPPLRAGLPAIRRHFRSPRARIGSVVGTVVLSGLWMLVSAWSQPTPTRPGLEATAAVAAPVVQVAGVDTRPSATPTEAPRPAATIAPPPPTAVPTAVPPTPTTAPTAVVQAAAGPDLAGLTSEEAQAAAQAAGVPLEVAEEPTLGTWAGVVFRQEPAAGAALPVGQPVRVIVSAGVVVPDVVGRPCGEAQAEVGQYGWSVNPVRWRFAERPDFGKVLQQEPAAGSLAAGPGEITVHLAGPVGPCA